VPAARSLQAAQSLEVDDAAELLDAVEELVPLLDVAAHFNLKAKLESGSSYFSFKRLVPGAFNVVLIVSTCTA
jgi:hypothetical protein